MNKLHPSGMFQRTALVLGRAGLEHLAALRVIVFGLGGVGSWCAEALVRTGCQQLTLVDADVICVTNVNRQVQATALNVGASKAQALQQRLHEINPQAKLAALSLAYEASTRAQFNLAQFDYVVDAIDTLEDKVLLIEDCVRAGVKLFSSMGAASRLDPTQVRAGTLDQTQGCPLARAVRRALRRRQIPLPAVPCVYSLEPPVAPALRLPRDADDGRADAPQPMPGFPPKFPTRTRLNGSLVQVTAVFGFVLASLILRDVLGPVSPGSLANSP